MAKRGRKTAAELPEYRGRLLRSLALYCEQGLTPEQIVEREPGWDSPKGCHRAVYRALEKRKAQVCDAYREELRQRARYLYRLALPEAEKGSPSSIRECARAIELEAKISGALQDNLNLTVGQRTVVRWAHEVDDAGGATPLPAPGPAAGS